MHKMNNWVFITKIKRIFIYNYLNKIQIEKVSLWLKIENNWNKGMKMIRPIICKNKWNVYKKNK